MDDGREAMFEGYATGVTFEPAKSNLKKIAKENPLGMYVKLRLRHEPDNPYDKNAIRVMTSVEEGIHLELGWVPKTHNEEVLETGLENVGCEFLKWTYGKDGQPKGFKFSILREEELMRG